MLGQPFTGPDGRRAWQRGALELKGRAAPLSKGFEQLDAYLDHLCQDTILVLFDRRSEAPPIEERTRIEEARSPKGRPVTLLRA